jgi:hypothetical protein
MVGQVKAIKKCQQLQITVKSPVAAGIRGVQIIAHNFNQFFYFLFV